MEAVEDGGEVTEDGMDYLSVIGGFCTAAPPSSDH